MIPGTPAARGVGASRVGRAARAGEEGARGRPAGGSRLATPTDGASAFASRKSLVQLCKGLAQARPGGARATPSESERPGKEMKAGDGDGAWPQEQQEEEKGEALEGRRVPPPLHDDSEDDGGNHGGDGGAPPHAALALGDAAEVDDGVGFVEGVENPMDEPAWAVEAAARELEARLALLRQYSNWRLNTRQYPSSPGLETSHALWALRQTASGGLSLVLPPEALIMVEEEEEEPEEEMEAAAAAEKEEEEEEEEEEEDHGGEVSLRASVASAPAAADGRGGQDFYRRGRSLASAIDEIQTYMSNRASRAWSRSASLAAAAAAAAATTGQRASPPTMPLDKRGVGARGIPMPGIEGGRLGPRATSAPVGSLLLGGTAATAAERDSLALRASLLAAAAAAGGGAKGGGGAAAVPAAGVSASLAVVSARERWLFAVADYAMSLLVFVTLSVTWWRGMWNLYDYYVFPNNRSLRIVALMAGGVTANVLAFLCYGPLREWGRRITSRREAYLYGGVKRLVILVRMLAAVAHWTGLWDWLDSAFCATDEEESCRFRAGPLWAITVAGLVGLVALRQVNATVWGPLFAVSLDFQCELVLDTSLRFGTNKQPIHDLPGLARRVADILATQWVPDVCSILAWYGIYTWLPLEWSDTSVAAELSYIGAAVAVALGCYAAQFVLAGLVDRYYPTNRWGLGSSSSMTAGGDTASGGGNRRRSLSSSSLSAAPRRHARGSGLGKYVAELTLYLWAFVAANLVWVFLWDFLDDHLLPANPALSNWLCVLVALPLEFALNVASTEVAGGVYLDGSGEGSSGLYFPLCYFGEVAAYRASLRSASTYSLYRRSTMAAQLLAHHRDRESELPASHTHMRSSRAASALESGRRRGLSSSRKVITTAAANSGGGRRASAPAPYSSSGGGNRRANEVDLSESAAAATASLLRAASSASASSSGSGNSSPTRFPLNSDGVVAAGGRPLPSLSTSTSTSGSGSGSGAALLSSEEARVHTSSSSSLSAVPRGVS